MPASLAEQLYAAWISTLPNESMWPSWPSLIAQYRAAWERVAEAARQAAADRFVAFLGELRKEGVTDAQMDAAIERASMFDTSELRLAKVLLMLHDPQQYRGLVEAKERLRIQAEREDAAQPKPIDRVALPACAVEGCPNLSDPRWFAHGLDGKMVQICDGHDGTPCKATTLADCTCPTRQGDLA